MQLSKSEYMMFLKHPAWLWLKKHDKSKLPEPDENLQAIFDAGVEFEKYANQRFEDGVTVGFDSYEEYQSMPNRTVKALESGAKTIFQGRINAGNLTCIFDIIDRVEDKTFDLYEVKSSTKVKKDHIYDLAFQVVVLESAGLEVRNISVIHVNKEYVRDGDIDSQQLSEVSDITGEVRDKIEETKNNIREAIATVNKPKLPDPSPRYLGIGRMGDWLDIYKNIRNVDEYSIYNLAYPSKTKISKLEDMGIEQIKDIPDDFDLTTSQALQVETTKRDMRIINKQNIEVFLERFQYPLYFLDYETAMSTIPLYDGTKPYQQVPFQYSLHTIEEPGADPVHSEYLHRDDDLPVPALLEHMKKNIGSKGSVIVWYKGFEMGRNREMAEMMPEYKEFLESINDRVIDLMEPFSNGWFGDKEFFGSASIKYVLPVLVPELSYKDLDVQEGASAQRLWMDKVLRDKDIGMSEEKLFDNLVEYCKLDTLAMVKIWEALKNEVKS